MDPFLNNDFTNKNAIIGGYINPTKVKRPKYVYTTNNDIDLEAYFNQPYTENNSNSYNITYLPGTSETYNNEYNNYSNTFSDKINSGKNNNSNNYYNYSLSNENISNTNYNNYGITENTAKSNISNYATIKPVIKKKENINYVYYDNNSGLLNPSTNVNYYSDNTTDFYTGLNTTTAESIPNLISNTTNNINNINLNENYSNVLNNNISNINHNYNYAPNISISSHISYNSNLSNNKTSNKNIALNKNIYSNKTSLIKNKERNLDDAIKINSKGLNKICSDYILNIITSFIKDDIKYKVFLRSKKFQKKLGLSLISYQEKSIKRTGINLCNYLSGYSDQKYGPHPYYNSIMKHSGNKYKLYFKKESLKEDFLAHLKKLKIKYIKSYLVYYFKKYNENKKDDSNLYLDIFCPFFDLLSNQEYFSELFTIPIDTRFIEQNKIENEYISTFKKLNNSKQNYSILFKFRKAKDFNFFKQCIYLTKVRKLTFFVKLTDDEKHPRIEHIGRTEFGNPYIKSIDYKCDPEKLMDEKVNLLFKTINSVDNLFTNLLCLKISIDHCYKVKEFYLIDNINNFKSLSYLELEYFIFSEQIFELKLNSIKVFKIINCKGITISDNSCLNLKELYIIKSDISYINSSLKFPNLEKLIFYLYLEDDNIKTSYNYLPRLNESIDFSSLNNLKVLHAEANDFLKLKNNTLESLAVVSNDNDNSKGKEKRIIEKIISMKSLKEVTISLKLLDDNDISKIPGQNPSVEKLDIYWDKTIPDCMIINLQKRFPNVNNFSLTNSSKNLFDTNLEIEENKNCKINKLALYGGNSNIKLYCLSFENLVEFDLLMYKDKFDGIKGSLPFMSKNCLLNFISLKSFKFKVSNLDFELLNNICDNLEKMPNLKTLKLESITLVDNIFFDKLNKKISLMKINDYNIVIYMPKTTFSLLHIKDKIISIMTTDGMIIRKQ